MTSYAFTTLKIIHLKQKTFLLGTYHQIFQLLQVYKYWLNFSLCFYENDSFWLILNGNGGFVGQYSKDFIFSFDRLIDQNIVFYFFAAFAMLFFLLSVRFDIGVVFNIIRFIYYKITKKDENIKFETSFEKKI